MSVFFVLEIEREREIVGGGSGRVGRGVACVHIPTVARMQDGRWMAQ